MSEPIVVALDDIPTEGAAEVHLGRSGFAIVLRRGSEVRAFLNVCPHAGRALNFAPNEFAFTPEDHLMCASHGATFDPLSGESMAGPCAGAYLTALRIERRDAQVLLYPPT